MVIFSNNLTLSTTQNKTTTNPNRLPHQPTSFGLHLFPNYHFNPILCDKNTTNQGQVTSYPVSKALMIIR